MTIPELPIPFPLAVGIAVLVLGGLLFSSWILFRRIQMRKQEDLPLYSVSVEDWRAKVAPAQRATRELPDISVDSSPLSDADPIPLHLRPTPPTPSRSIESGQPSALPAEPITANGVPGMMIEGHTMRFSIPQEGTLQFLPGRLEVLSGPDAGRDIRFVHIPGSDNPDVTFGRREGPAYRHIQLREATVSRLHARLRMIDGKWHLLNHSATNPVVWNSRPLNHGDSQALSDGDRIEMGEVVFGFRSR